MAIGTRRMRRRTERADYQPHDADARKAERDEKEFEKKRADYYEAKKNFEEVCGDKHGRRTGCQEAFGLLKTAAKGAGIVLGHLGTASSKMSDMVEEDLYRRSPAGERDKALVKLMMEREDASKKKAKGSKIEKFIKVTTADGKTVIINEKELPRQSRSRRR